MLQEPCGARSSDTAPRLGRAGCPTRPTARSLALGCRHLPAAQQTPRPSGRWGKDPSPLARTALRGRARTCSVAPRPGQASPGSFLPRTGDHLPTAPGAPTPAGAGRRRAGRGGSAHRHGPRRRPHHGPGDQRRTTRDIGDGSTTAPGTRRDLRGDPSAAPGRAPQGRGAEPELPHADAGGFRPPSRAPSRGHGLPASPAGRVTRAGTRGRDAAPCPCLTAEESLPACSQAADAAGGAGTPGSASHPLPVVPVASHLPRRPRLRPGRAAPPDPQPSPPRAPQASAATGGRP